MSITIDRAAAFTEHFSRRLEFETDCVDVATALAGASGGPAVIDSRSPEAYEAGHVPGAVNLARPYRPEDIAALEAEDLVVYCWGPSCNGAIKAALELARLGYPAKEMLGGFEYWVREGHPVEGSQADDFLAAADEDGLVKVRGAISCMCA